METFFKSIQSLNYISEIKQIHCKNLINFGSNHSDWHSITPTQGNQLILSLSRNDTTTMSLKSAHDINEGDVRKLPHVQNVL